MKRRYSERTQDDPFSYPTGSAFYVYVHRASDGRPLYVGMTNSPKQRTITHRSHFRGNSNRSYWFGAVASIEWIGFADKCSALSREQAMIRHLLPEHNVQNAAASITDREVAERELFTIMQAA